jgi:RecB family endonuclease NucS
MEGDVAQEEQLSPTMEEDVETDAVPGSSEFLLEKDLQRYLAENLDTVEQGLRLYEEDGIKGIEFEAGGGRRIDILAVDKMGALVVLELKVSKGYDRVVGQLLRYMTWVRYNVAEGQPVRGIIVCRNMTDDLKLACTDLSNVDLFEYQLSVTVTRAQRFKYRAIVESA